MKFFRHETKERELTIYPLVCFHIGAAQSDTQFIEEHIARIAKNPKSRWVYLGDGGECVTKVSKGDLYDQRLSPDEQIDRLVELLKPVRGQGLFGVSGNHDRRIAKLSGLDWTHALCSRLAIPYMGLSCFMRLTFRNHKTTVSSYNTFWHHGTDSSSLLGGKIRAAQKLDDLVDADAIFSAHSHVCMEIPPKYRAYIPANDDAIGYKEIRNFVCGCAYDSRVPGYAEEKGYSPILPAHLAVTFRGSRTHRQAAREQKHMECEIWRKQA